MTSEEKQAVVDALIADAKRVCERTLGRLDGAEQTAFALGYLAAQLASLVYGDDWEKQTGLDSIARIAGRELPAVPEQKRKEGGTA